MATSNDRLAVLRWQFDRAETALSAMDDIGWGKSDAAGEIDEFMEDVQQEIARLEATDGTD